MSQRITYSVLKSLGGMATLPEIREAVKRDYGNTSLVQCFEARLYQLKKWGYIEYIGRHPNIIYKIIEDYPEERLIQT